MSRRIGLSDQILAGARMTGQIDRFSVGLLNIETGEGMGDLLGSGSAGAIFTNHQQGDLYNRALGIDAQYRFWSSSLVNGWYTNVWDSDPVFDEAAGHALVRLQNDR